MNSEEIDLKVAKSKDELGLVYDDDFSKCGKVHDWRNHVPDDVQDIWSSLTTREKSLVIIVADNAAQNEEWD